MKRFVLALTFLLTMTVAIAVEYEKDFTLQFSSAEDAHAILSRHSRSQKTAQPSVSPEQKQATTAVAAPTAAPPTAGAKVPIGTVVPALPAGCKSVAVGNYSYSECGGVFYRPAFQGSTLVYVVVDKPL